MNTPSINVSRLNVHVELLAVLALALLPTIVFAHGGEVHVSGTVTMRSYTSLTVKTPACKTVEVSFDAKTTYARATLSIQKTDVKVGDRIVIHAVEVNAKLIAHTVEVGAATTASKTK